MFVEIRVVNCNIIANYVLLCEYTEVEYYVDNFASAKSGCVLMQPLCMYISTNSPHEGSAYNCVPHSHVYTYTKIEAVNLTF